MKHPLTLYALREPVKDFDEAVRPEVLDDPTLEILDHGGDDGFDARLYSVPVEPSEPAWAELLRGGFPDFTATPSAMARVAVVLRLRIDAAHRFFAATFGSGRFLLRTEALEKKYGLRVALNAIYAGDDRTALTPLERLRQVSVTQLAKNTMHTRRQSNRNAAFQDFGVDLTRDLFGAVTGVPSDTGSWGSRISGSDSLRVQVIDDFPKLEGLCRRLAATRAKTDYRVRFEAIDRIRSIPNEETAELVRSLLERVEEAPETVTLAPPTLVDFDQVSKFRFSPDPEVTFDDLRLEEYLQILADHELKPTEELLRAHKVEALDDQGEVSLSWSVFETLDTELRVDGRTILLVSGDFFAVSDEVIEKLNRFVDSIEESGVVLPTSFFNVEIDAQGKEKIKEESEGAYNERAAEPPDCFLLDKATVRIDTHADPIEVCDVLTTGRQFIHVKRKFSSSSLSHLFGQGFVSGELFCSAADYREKILEKLGDQEAFTALIPDRRPDTSQFEIVYAIIGKWEGARPSERLPFFSKLNLRRHTSDLRALGFKVTYKPIDLVQA